jgi:hypothetical protein
VCIQGNWSNLADAKIKGGIASLALDSADPPYNPLYARALHTPRPWGVTAVFTEYTGVHDPLALDWSLRSSGLAMPSPASEPLPSATLEEPGFVQPAMVLEPVAPQEAVPVLASDRRVAQPSAAFETLWDFSRALNRLDRVALDLAARDARPEIMVDGLTVKKLLGTFWFRSVFPRLSESWRERLFDALAANIVFPNHQMRLGRRSARLKELTHEQIKEIATKTLVPGPAGVDLQLLLTIADLWGEGALGRLRFEEVAEAQDPSRLSALLGFRSSTS